MKVLGIDPSSSISAYAVVEHLSKEVNLLDTGIWKKEDRKSPAWNLHDYFLTVITWCEKSEADMACVESLSVTRNAQASRVISHYQAASVIACKECGLTVVEARATSARREALGSGKLSKDEAWLMVKKMFPDHQFRAKTSGGTDEADAAVLGVACPGIAEL
jgi:Holliday junction resolvasome RuvABC endonuclease subunit